MSLFIFWLCSVVILQLRPIDDVDTFAQIALGHIQIASGSLISSEPFSYMLWGKPIPNPGWLAQIIFSALYDLAGWNLLKLVHDIFFVSAFVIIGILLFRIRGQTCDIFSGLGAVVLAFLVAASNSSLRPQGIAVFCFSSLLFIVQTKCRPWQKTIVVIPLMLVWQNCHPSLSLGTIALFAIILGHIFEYPRAFRSQTLMHLLGFLFLSLAFQLATPDFFGILEVNRQNVIVSRTWLKISEWMPPWRLSVIKAMIPFWIILLFTFIFMVRWWKRLKISDIILSAAFLPFTLFAARFALFWALLSIPIWANMIFNSKGNQVLAWKEANLSAEKARKNIIFAGILTLVAIFLLTSAPKLSPDIPIEPMRKLKEAVPSARVYNYREWAGPLLFVGYPDWKVAIDGRLYLYPRRDWESYAQAAIGKIPVSILEEKHRPDVFFLEKKSQSGLVKRLREMPGWQIYHEDFQTIVFIKRDFPPKIH